jgi:hypothetical protein
VKNQDISWKALQRFYKGPRGVVRTLFVGELSGFSRFFAILAALSKKSKFTD